MSDLHSSGENTFSSEEAIWEHFRQSPNVIMLSQFSDQILGLSEQAFIERFEHPFLVLLSQLEEDGERNKYVTHGTDATGIRKLMDSPVFFVKKGTRNVFEGMITVGRTENNDISIPWSKLSKFHAYFSNRGDDWFVTDHSSSNGTYINQERITAKKAHLLEGASVDLSFSKSLAFFFMTPAGMYSYVGYMRRIGKTKP